MSSTNETKNHIYLVTYVSHLLNGSWKRRRIDVGGYRLLPFLVLNNPMSPRLDGRVHDNRVFTIWTIFVFKNNVATIIINIYYFSVVGWRIINTSSLCVLIWFAHVLLEFARAFFRRFSFAGNAALWQIVPRITAGWRTRSLFFSVFVAIPARRTKYTRVKETEKNAGTAHPVWAGWKNGVRDN